MQSMLNPPRLTCRIKGTFSRMISNLNASLVPFSPGNEPFDLSLHAWRRGHQAGLLVHPYVMYDLIAWDNAEIEDQRLSSFLDQIGRAVRYSGYTETWLTHDAIPRNNSCWHAQPHRLVARWQVEEDKWLVTYQ